MNASQIVLAVLGAVAFTAILAFFSLRQQKTSWAGQLESKSYYKDQDYQECFTLIFRTDQGKKVKMKVFKNMYETFSIGDKAIKRSGSGFPEKI